MKRPQQQIPSDHVRTYRRINGIHDVAGCAIDIQTYKHLWLEPKHKIFLSHSGAQKDFVEQLCIDLERAQHFPFFDKLPESLAKGLRFPDLILQAAEQCKVAIIVLSEEYFTRSKWPMLELASFVQSQCSSNIHMGIIVLYFGLSRVQCKETKRQNSWTEVWLDWAKDDPRINTKMFFKALKGIAAFNSLEYVKAKGEVAFRKEVVDAVCKLIQPEVMWDDSHVQGKTQLSEEVLQKFQQIGPSQKYRVRVVGLYGMAGVGKTTLCKILCNKLRTEYCAKVFHAELGTQRAVDLQKEVLKELTEANLKLLKCVVTVEDKLRDLLNKRMYRHRVFLALDNVWDTKESRNQAMTYLQAGYQDGSTVLVTARTLDILLTLGIDPSHCLKMPQLDEENATALFLYYAAPVGNPLFIKNDQNIIQSCIKRCFYSNGQYLPLALKVLGSQIGALSGDPSQLKLKLNKIDFNHLRELEHPIFSILRTGYDLLPNLEKLIFLDLALFLPTQLSERHQPNIFNWLSIIHGLNFNELMMSLNALKRKSLLEDFGNGFSKIIMHDLYRDFAVMEGNAQSHDKRLCLYETVSTNYLAELEEKSWGGQWQYIRRLSVSGSTVQNLGKSQFHSCSNIVALVLQGCKSLEELDLKWLVCLRSLDVQDCEKVREGDYGLKALKSLIWLRWTSETCNLHSLQDIESLTRLQVLEVSCKTCSKLCSPPKLQNCTSLRELTLRGHQVASVPNLSNLILLQQVDFQFSYVATQVLGFSSKLSNLVYLHLGQCSSIRDLPDLGELIALQKLNLSCTGLEKLPDLHKLKNLQVLDISCSDFSEINAINSLFNLRILVCQWSRIYELPDLGNLQQLRVLDLQYSKYLKNIVGIGNLPSLRYINVAACESLVHLPRLNNLVHLEKNVHEVGSQPTYF